MKLYSSRFVGNYQEDLEKEMAKYLQYKFWC